MRTVAVFGFIATAFASSAFAHGYDSLTRYDLGVSMDLAPVVSATTIDGGLWLLAPGTREARQLVRLDASGTRSVGLYLPPRLDSENSDRFTIYPLADGGVLELDTHNSSAFEPTCILRSITKQGALRFERNVRQPDCRLKLSKPGLAPYLLSNVDGAVLLSEDGSLASSFLSSGSNASLIRAEFVNNDILLLRSNNTRTGYVLSRASDNGTQLWSTPLENVRFEQNVTVRGLSDGRALALIADAAKLQLRFYSALGALTETREIVMPELLQARFGIWAVDGQGNFAIALSFAASGGTNYGAILFKPDGMVLKQVRYEITDQCRADCPLLGLDQGFANALTTPTGGKLVLTSLSPNVANTEIILDGAFKPRIARGSNGAILLTSDRAFRAFNASGVEIAAPSVIGKGMTQQKILAAALAQDGKSFVVNQNFDDGKTLTRLESFAASGAQLWKRTIPDVGSSQVWANDARVCVSKVNSSLSDATLGCFASATGVELSSVVIPSVAAPRIRTRFLADGRLRVVYATGGNGLEIVDVLNDGTVNQVSIVTNQVKAIIDIGASGAVLIAATLPGSSFTDELVALLPSGAIAFRRAISNTFLLNQVSGRILENSEVLISTPSESSSSTFDTVLLSSLGAQRWAVSSPRLTANDFESNSLADEKNVYLIRIGGSSAQMRAYALSLVTGAGVWTQELKVAQLATTEIYEAPNGNELLVFSSSETGVLLSRLSDTSGAVLEQRFLDCGVARCTLRANKVSSAGDFHAVSDTQEFGQKTIALGRAAVATKAAEVSADQTGLSGAWYTPQISGQGFFVEYFPQNKLLFAPWFTFSEPDISANGDVLTADSVANLRWYTLSGVVEPGAKLAQLEIRRNVAGVFNSAPITESTVVGSATLRAQDCNRATLEFEFISSEAQGKYGVLPLDRLAGGSAPCQLSSGQILPGRDMRPARGGFDGRQSGSWYQPQTAGQGLMMTVQPATASEPGFFFGGWFTYDAGAPNDPTAQHWLTLSGEIPVNAQSGVVPVTIYRTLGGQLASVPTQNNTILGHGAVTFAGCESALLRYQFDDTLIVGSFRARAGEINLQRLGVCPAQ